MVSKRMLSRLGTKISITLDCLSGWPAFVAVISVGLFVVASVTSRYAFNHPLHFVEEYSGYLMVALIYLPLAWVLRHAGHIRLPLVVKALPRRAANCVEMATVLISLVVIVVLFISVTQVVMDSFVRGIKAWTLMATPLGPVQLILPIGLGLFTIQIIIEIARRIREWGGAHIKDANN